MRFCCHPEVFFSDNCICIRRQPTEKQSVKSENKTHVRFLLLSYYYLVLSRNVFASVTIMASNFYLLKFQLHQVYAKTLHDSMHHRLMTRFISSLGKYPSRPQSTLNWDGFIASMGCQWLDKSTQLSGNDAYQSFGKSTPLLWNKATMCQFKPAFRLCALSVKQHCRVGILKSNKSITFVDASFALFI